MKPIKKEEKKEVKKDEDEDLIENWNKSISNVLLSQNYKNINKKIVGVIERQKFVSLDRLINLFKPDLMKKLFNKYKGQFVLDGLIRFVKYNDNYNRRIQFDKFKDYFETKMKGNKLLTLSQTGMIMSTRAESGGMSEKLQKVIRDNWKRNYEGIKEVKKEEKKEVKPVKKEEKKEVKKEVKPVKKEVKKEVKADTPLNTKELKVLKLVDNYSGDPSHREYLWDEAKKILVKMMLTKKGINKELIKKIKKLRILTSPVFGGTTEEMNEWLERNFK